MVEPDEDVAVDRPADRRHIQSVAMEEAHLFGEAIWVVPEVHRTMAIMVLITHTHHHLIMLHVVAMLVVIIITGTWAAAKETMAAIMDHHHHHITVAHRGVRSEMAVDQPKTHSGIIQEVEAIV